MASSMTSPKGSFHWIGNSRPSSCRAVHSSLKIGQAHVLHQLSVDLWLDLSLEILVVDGMNIASDLEGDSCTLRHIKGDMGAFKRSDSADKTEVRLLVLDQFVLSQINAMMDRAHPGHRFLFGLSPTDTNVMDLGIKSVKRT